MCRCLAPFRPPPRFKAGCLDATEDISRFAHIGTVIIVGGDSDFMPVAPKSYHEFRYYDRRVEAPGTEDALKPSEAKDTPPPPPADPAAEMLKRAVRLLGDRQDIVAILSADG